MFVSAAWDIHCRNEEVCFLLHSTQPSALGRSERTNHSYSTSDTIQLLSVNWVVSQDCELLVSKVYVSFLYLYIPNAYGPSRLWFIIILSAC